MVPWRGQLYGRVKLFDDHIVNLYRYEYNTPFIGKNDNRMTPNTFEGYTSYLLFVHGSERINPTSKNNVADENEFKL